MYVFAFQPSTKLQGFTIPKMSSKPLASTVTKPVTKTVTATMIKAQKSSNLVAATKVQKSSKAHKPTKTVAGSKVQKTTKTVADTKTQKSTKPAPASGTVCTGSKHCPDRVTRVSEALSSPYFKVNCTFLTNVLPVFLKPNQALQHEKPVIHKSRRILLDFFKSLLLRFVKPVAITEDLLQVEYSRRENQKEDTELMVGEEVKKVLEECSGEEKAQSM